MYVSRFSWLKSLVDLRNSDRDSARSLSTLALVVRARRLAICSLPVMPAMRWPWYRSYGRSAMALARSIACLRPCFSEDGPCAPFFALSDAAYAPPAATAAAATAHGIVSLLRDHLTSREPTRCR